MSQRKMEDTVCTNGGSRWCEEVVVGLKSRERVRNLTGMRSRDSRQDLAVAARHLELELEKMESKSKSKSKQRWM